MRKVRSKQHFFKSLEQFERVFWILTRFWIVFVDTKAPLKLLRGTFYSQSDGYEVCRLRSTLNCEHHKTCFEGIIGLKLCAMLTLFVEDRWLYASLMSLLCLMVVWCPATIFTVWLNWLLCDLQRLSSAPIPFTVLSITGNPCNEDFLAVSGLKVSGLEAFWDCLSPVAVSAAIQVLLFSWSQLLV